MSLDPDDRNSVMLRIATHAAGAGAFFFALQYLALKETVTTSVVWALFFALAGGLLAWSQVRR